MTDLQAIADAATRGGDRSVMVPLDELGALLAVVEAADELDLACQREPREEFGYRCGACGACDLRSALAALHDTEGR